MSWLDSRNSIIEVLRSHPHDAARLWVEAGHERAVAEIVLHAKQAGVSVRIIPREQFGRKFRGVKSHVCLERAEFAYMDGDDLLGTLPALPAPFLCAFDGILDPQNLGNVIRTAACFGADGVILPRDRACPVNETVTNIAQGGAEHVKISRVTNLSRYIEEIKERNIFCFGLDERGTKSLFDMDLTIPVCLVLGGEEGLRRLTGERCDMLLKIPTSPGFPSLNVANAFSVAAYEVVRQRAVKRAQGQ
jgi:23S rRNA (guanosine2251-2'-O)-methyltransferase